MIDLQTLADRVEIEALPGEFTDAIMTHDYDRFASLFASGRSYITELGHMRDGSSQLNYSLYHDRYQRTPDGWKFTERVYEVRYFDASALAGSSP